jgi:hypothetical protein
MSVQALTGKTRGERKRPRLRTWYTVMLRTSAWGKVLLFLDQIKREKGVWWMPWQQEAMKDVIPCDKLWGAGNRL